MLEFKVFIQKNGAFSFCHVMHKAAVVHIGGFKPMLLKQQS